MLRWKIGMLRALLGEQTHLWQRANHQALEEGFRRVQEMWEERLVLIDSTKGALTTALDRCCMLEERLQRLEEGDSGAVNGSTVVADGDQKVGKKKGRRRNKVEPCKTVDHHIDFKDTGSDACCHAPTRVAIYGIDEPLFIMGVLGTGRALAGSNGTEVRGVVMV